MAKKGKQPESKDKKGKEKEKEKEKEPEADSKQADRQIKQTLKKAKEKQQWAVESKELVRFEKQLELLGLLLKDVKGDGNCLFRALGDQYNGDGDQHAEYRKNVINYIQQHREDFEPFMEAEVEQTFDQYVRQLAQDGTYAGHWALIAFSRHYHVNITIHQLEQTSWKIMSFDHPNTRVLHVAYFGYEHYSSIRNIGGSQSGPATIVIRPKAPEGEAGSPSAATGGSDSKSNQKGKGKGKEKNPTVYLSMQEKQIIDITGCTDLELIRTLLDARDYDTDAVIEILSDQVASSDLNANENQIEPSYVEIPNEMGYAPESYVEYYDDNDQPIPIPAEVSVIPEPLNENSKSHSHSSSNSSPQATLQKPQNENSKPQNGKPAHQKPVSHRETKELAKKEKKERRAQERREQANLKDSIASQTNHAGSSSSSSGQREILI